MVANITLGKSGLVVSNLCLGCMNFGESTPEKESIEILEKAFSEGIYFWDTADRYENGLSEEIVGQAVKKIGKRDQLVIATKVRGKTGSGPNDKGLSRKHIIKAAEASLKRLNTDYIDLYQMHRPDIAPIEETLMAFETLVQSGKILYYGTSTFASWQMAETEWVSRMLGISRPISEQAPYNILDRRIENDRGGFLDKYGWGLLTWSPLGGGQLTGKYTQANVSDLPQGSRAQRNSKYQSRMNQESIDASAKFVKLCQEYGYNPAPTAIAWLLHQDIVTAPILGPRTIEHLTSLLPAASMNLSDEFLEEIDRIVPPGTAKADFLSPNVSWQVGYLGGIK